MTVATTLVARQSSDLDENCQSHQRGAVDVKPEMALEFVNVLCVFRFFAERSVKFKLKRVAAVTWDLSTRRALRIELIASKCESALEIAQTMIGYSTSGTPDSLPRQLLVGLASHHCDLI
jgi:hypothetical protein